MRRSVEHEKTVPTNTQILFFVSETRVIRDDKMWNDNILQTCTTVHNTLNLFNEVYLNSEIV